MAGFMCYRYTQEESILLTIPQCSSCLGRFIYTGLYTLHNTFSTHKSGIKLAKVLGDVYKECIWICHVLPKQLLHWGIGSRILSLTYYVLLGQVISPVHQLHFQEYFGCAIRNYLEVVQISKMCCFFLFCFFFVCVHHASIIFWCVCPAISKTMNCSEDV